MRIEKIEIENFRGFKGKHEVVFQPDINVFVGTNGAGKSSILDLIGMFLSLFTERIDPISTRRTLALRLGKYDINRKETITQNTISIKAETKENKLWDDNEAVKWQIKRSIYDDRNNYDDESLRKVRDILRMLRIGEMMNLPIIKYFHSSRRAIGYNYETRKGILSKGKDYSNPLAFYNDAFGISDDFFYWFSKEENKENRKKLKEGLNYSNPILDTVRKALEVFFKSLSTTKFTKIHIEDESDEKINSDSENLFIEKNGENFNFYQLSDGERMTILLVADIAFRLALANQVNSEPLKGNGIVLIDEIETHLHPAWQQEIINSLKTTFPNIQFFITTHSPQVLSSVDKRNVHIIEDFKFYKSPQTKGRDTNSILSEVFGVLERPEYAYKDFNTLYKLIDDPETEREAAIKLTEMKKTYGENDPDWQRAKMHFDFLTAKPIE